MYSQLPSMSGGRSSIRNLRTRHAVVTGTHLSQAESIYLSYQELMLLILKAASSKMEYMTWLCYSTYGNYNSNCRENFTVFQCRHVVVSSSCTCLHLTFMTKTHTKSALFKLQMIRYFFNNDGRCVSYCMPYDKNRKWKDSMRDKDGDAQARQTSFFVCI
jgi:hypothetical protein